MTWHLGRAWVGHEVEDACPCPKAPCGLAITLATIICPDHHPADTLDSRTIRQAHTDDACPARASAD